MRMMYEHGWDENMVLGFVTLHAAEVMQQDLNYGSLQAGMQANFVVCTDVPGLEVTDSSEIKEVYYLGNQVIDKRTR